MPTTRMRMTETNSYRMTRTDHDRSGPMSFANFADEMCEIPHASSAPSSSNDTLLRESSISKGKAKGSEVGSMWQSEQSSQAENI